MEVLGQWIPVCSARCSGAIVEGRTKDCICSLEEIVIQGRELGQFVTDVYMVYEKPSFNPELGRRRGSGGYVGGEFKAAEKRCGQDRRNHADAVYPYLFRIVQTSCAMPARSVVLGWEVALSS